MTQHFEMEVDSLRYLFGKARESLMPESEAVKNNLTAEYNDWKKEKIDARELIVIAIRGEVRTGKSTVEIHEVWDINKYMQKTGLNPNAEQYMWKWIFSDQTEFLRFINGEERNVALGIDEFNRLANRIVTGKQDGLLSFFE